MTPLLSPPSASGADTSNDIGSGQPQPQGQPEPTIDVGEGLRNELSDDERELHIRDCGERMQAAMARYEAHGCFGDRGEADRWLRLQTEAIRGRSAAQVARMLQAQAERMALEPGAAREPA